MIDETVFKQSDGQRQVSDRNILVTESSNLVSDLLVSNVIETVADEDDVKEDRCLFEDDCQMIVFISENSAGYFLMT